PPHPRVAAHPLHHRRLALVAALYAGRLALVVRGLVLELLAELGEVRAVVADEAVEPVDPRDHLTENLGGRGKRTAIGLGAGRGACGIGLHEHDRALAIPIDDPCTGAYV